MQEFKYNVGSEVKDKVTGFTGIIMGRTQYLTGCNTYGVQSQKIKDNSRPEDWKWFDEDQLSLLKDKKIVIYDDEEELPQRTGGVRSSDQYPG